MQEGRPISDAEYRSGTAQRQATGQLGWSDDYWQARSGGVLQAAVQYEPAGCSADLFSCMGPATNLSVFIPEVPRPWP